MQTYRLPVQTKSTERTVTGGLRIVVEGVLEIPPSQYERDMRDFIGS